jgi:ABC-type uncharacterized transport system ATPase component
VALRAHSAVVCENTNADFVKNTEALSVKESPVTSGPVSVTASTVLRGPTAEDARTIKRVTRTKKIRQLTPTENLLILYSK